MAQDLIFTPVAWAVAGAPVDKPDRSARAGAEAPRPRPSRRPALPFRAVNQRGSPGHDPGLQRHHLLPRQLLSHRCFAALFEDIGGEWPGFDDFRSNGLLLPASDSAALRIGLPLHRGPHRDYNAMVIERVGRVEADWARARRRTPQEAQGDAIAGLQLLQRALRRRLLDQGRKRLALSRFDPLGRSVDFTDIEAMVDSLWPENDPWAEPAPLRDQAPAWAAAIPARAANWAFA